MLLNNLEGYELLLASQSPRRRELLGMLGLEFKIAPTIDVDESYPPELPAEEVPEFLARLKADAYQPTLQPNQLLITADTVVIAEGRVFGKPRDKAEAAEMLNLLSGRSHLVVTGVALTTTQRQESLSAVTEVDFAELSAEEIDYYIERYRPFDKAGAYGIQEWIGCIGIRGISGSYYNVMGLPLHRLYDALKGF